MTYAGSINALSGINFKGDEFTRKYEQHLSLWRTCSSDIDALKRKISDLLSNGRVDKSEIEGYRLKIADIDKELLDIQAQINKGNPNVAENLKQVEIDIMNFRRLKSDYEKKRGERQFSFTIRESKEKYIISIRDRLPKLQSEIDDLTITLRGYQSKLDSTGDASLKAELKSIEQKDKHCSTEINLLANSEMLYVLIGGVKNCDSEQIKKLEKKIQEKETQRKTLEEHLKPDDPIFQVIDKDIKDAREILAAQKEVSQNPNFQIHSKAGLIKGGKLRQKLKDIEADRAENRRKKQEILEKIAKFDRDNASLKRQIADIEIRIKSKQDDLDRTNKEILSIESVISKIQIDPLPSYSLEDLENRKRTLEIERSVSFQFDSRAPILTCWLIKTDSPKIRMATFMKSP